MTGLHPLDKHIGGQWPELATQDALRAFEQTPYDERIAAQSTYEALQLGAARDPDAAERFARLRVAMDTLRDPFDGVGILTGIEPRHAHQLTCCNVLIFNRNSNRGLGR